PMLRTAFFALKRDAAPGVDGLRWQDYETDLDRRIEDLHARVHRGAYRAQPSRRRHPGNKGGAATADASADPRSGALAEASRHWVLRLPRCADQRRGVERLPLPCDVSVATQPPAA